MDMPPNGNNNNNNDGDDNQQRRIQAKHTTNSDTNSQEEQQQGVVDMFGDTNELPVWLFLFLAALLNEQFRSFYGCTC